MMPKECKRIAEVDFPIAVVSQHSAREKSIRHGHPSTLHLWWARRPLAACRAMLLALLLPDPCDPHCPGEFKNQARRLLLKLIGNAGPDDIALRKAILKFIGDFANWDSASNPVFLKVGRGLVKAAHPEENPLVVDPFAGGGSIPLEALRLGCETFASDLNLVACLILKAMLEDIPRQGPDLAEELRRVGDEIKKKVEQELTEFYPRDPDGATPIAYLWARTVKCESPNCGAEIPLARSFWLCKKINRKRALRYKINKSADGPPQADFEVFEPEADLEVPKGSVSRAKATCLCCGTILPPERVRAQLTEQRGGAEVIFDQGGNRVGGALLLAVVTTQHSEQGRHYRLPEKNDYILVKKAQVRLATIIEDWAQGGKHGLYPVPDEPLPLMSGTFNVPLYGMNEWGDLFNARQKVQLLSTMSIISQTTDKKNNQVVIKKLLVLSLGKILRHYNVVSKWHRGSETVAGAFGMQAIPMSWDYPELFPLTKFAGGLDDAITSVIDTVSHIAGVGSICGQVENVDAIEFPLPDQTVSVWFTDPPYYFAIPYADLSDFFFVWLKRALLGYSGLTDRYNPSNPLTHKQRELCEMSHWDPIRYKDKDKEFFEEGIRSAFAEGQRTLKKNDIGCVVFAHKTTEGWEALLSGMNQAGWTITASWPIATERGARLRARDSAALATSVHLVCRPRPEDAPVGDWGEMLRELPERVGNRVEYLQEQGIRGADLIFCLLYTSRCV